MDPYAAGSAATAVLVGARIGGMLLIAPVFASRTVPMMLRTSLLVLLVILLQPVVFAATSGSPSLTAAALLTETLTGFAIGFGAALFIGAAEAAGDFMAVQMGLSGAASLDPLTQHSVPVLGQFTSLFAITMLLATDGHLVMIAALMDSFTVIPVGAPVDAAAGIGALISMGTLLFSLGLQFAAPVVAVVLIVNAALAVLGRAAPQLNVLAVAFPVQIGVGLLALAATVPLFGAVFLGWRGEYDAAVLRVLDAMRIGAR